MSLFLFDERMCARWRTTEGGEMFIYEGGAGYMRFFEGTLIAIVRTYVIVYAFWKRKPRGLVRLFCSGFLNRVMILLRIADVIERIESKSRERFIPFFSWQ